MIQTVIDKKRGCGWRKEGGLYLRCDGLARPCGLFPMELRTCPTCGHGIKPSRGWQWIDPQPLVDQQVGRADPDLPDTRTCNLADMLPGTDACLRCWESWGNQAGLLWIGGSFYKTPLDFMEEAQEQGVSRRIPAVPTGFELGTHWVFVAHREHHHEMCPTCKANGAKQDCPTCKGKHTVPVQAIFQAFKPTSVEYVTTEAEQQLARGLENAKAAGTEEMWRANLPKELAETLKKLEGLAKRGVTPVKVERADT